MSRSRLFIHLLTALVATAVVSACANDPFAPSGVHEAVVGSTGKTPTLSCWDPANAKTLPSTRYNTRNEAFKQGTRT